MKNTSYCATSTACPPAGPLGVDVPHQTGGRRREAGHRVVQRGARAHRGIRVRLTLEREIPAVRLGGEVVRRRPDAGGFSRAAVAGDVDDREARVRPPKRFIGKTELVVGPRSRRLDPDIGVAGEVEEHVVTPRRPHVESHRELVAGVLHPGLRDLLTRSPARKDWPERSSRVRVRRAEGGSLDVDDLGSELSEIGRGPRAGDEAGGFQHPDARERTVIGYDPGGRWVGGHRLRADPPAINDGVQGGTSGSK